MKSIILVLPALLALAACDGGTQGAGTTTEETQSDGAVVGGAVAPSPGPTSAITEIPAAIRGRWGLVAADCEPGRDDAKGLLTITATQLKFYESVATLDTVDDANAGRIRASFEFEGEGMTWQRDGLLEVEDGGNTLVRREYGADAAPQPFRYTKCNKG